MVRRSESCQRDCADEAASRARCDEERAKSGRVVIVSSLFLVLFTAALLIGGHAAIDPLLQSAVDARETKGAGAVV